MRSWHYQGAFSSEIRTDFDISTDWYVASDFERNEIRVKHDSHTLYCFREFCGDSHGKSEWIPLVLLPTKLGYISSNR